MNEARGGPNVARAGTGNNGASPCANGSPGDNARLEARPPSVGGERTGRSRDAGKGAERRPPPNGEARR